MKVRQTTPQPEYDAEQFDGVNVPKLLLDKNGDLDVMAQWIVPELDWHEQRSASRPAHAPVLQVSTLHGSAQVHSGYWVLRDRIGAFEVWDDASFRKNFTPTDMDEWAGETFMPALKKAIEDRTKTYSGGAV